MLESPEEAVFSFKSAPWMIIYVVWVFPNICNVLKGVFL